MAQDPWAAFEGGTVQQAPAAAAQPDWSAFEGTSAPAPAQSAAATVATTPPPADTLGRRLGLGVRDVVEGVAGMPYNAVAKPLQLLGVPVHTLGENLTALGLPEPQTNSERLVSAVAQPIASTLTGQGVGRMMMGMASPIAQGVGQALASQPGAQAAAAGVGGAVQEETGSPIAGLAAGLATPFVGAAIGRAISPNILADIPPPRAAAIATAEQEGVPLSLAQMTGGKVARNFESTLANLPGSSAGQAAFNDAQSAAFNQAVMRRTGTASATALPDDLNTARANLGRTFDDLSARNVLQHDPQSQQELTQLVQDVHRYAPADVQRQIVARVQDAVDLAPNGQMPGQAYRQLDSTIGQAIRGAGNGDVRNYLGRLRDTLRGAMDRSIAPDDQDAWRQVRGQYANLMTVAKAMNRPSEGTALGGVSPAALAQAGNNSQTKSFAFGRGNLDDLSRLGQIALKQTVPDSGTAQRTMMANLLQGRTLMPAAMAAFGTGVNPAYALAAPVAEVGVPYLASQAYRSNLLRNYLVNDLAAPVTPRPNALLGATIAAEQQAGRLRDR